jgi:hypothetical protein
MAYHIEFAERAGRDLEAPYVEKNAAESQAAPRWYNGLEEAVYALANYLHRCPAAPEARKLRRELRRLLYGKKPHVYPSFMKLMSVGRQSGCSRFVTAQGGSSRRLRLNEPPRKAPEKGQEREGSWRLTCYRAFQRLFLSLSLSGKPGSAAPLWSIAAPTLPLPSIEFA